MTDDVVMAFARRLGIETGYWDVHGRRHEASIEALRVILGCMGVSVPSGTGILAEAVLAEMLDQRVTAAPAVVWDGDRVEFEIAVPPSSVGEPRGTVVLEDGVEVELGRPAVAQGTGPTRRWLVFDSVGGEAHGGLPFGYHRIVLASDRGGTHTHLIERPLWVAPRGVAGPDVLERLWGVFAPLYAVPVGGHGPSVTTLDRLGEWIAGFGGRMVATLPLLAGFVGYGREPYDPGPYAPVSRLHWNELYLDLDRLGLPRPGSAAAAVGTRRPFDYRDVASARRLLIERELSGPIGELVARGETSRYAAFRATLERFGAPWAAWPTAARNGDLRPGRDYDVAAAAFHELCQRAMQDQLDDLHHAFRRRDQRLYLDLPLGAHPAGFETWADPELYAWGASIGAPPDEFFERGQDWGLPPVRPDAASARGHDHFRSVVAHHCRVAGVLRIDHVMGLHRLFWVPEGADPTDGVYVRYPMNELLAVLAIESVRNDCYVVGEDLGTVPDEVREGMARHDVLGMYVAEFRTPGTPGGGVTPPWQRCVASVDTHDTPTFAGWVEARDVDQRIEIGGSDSVAADAARRERAEQVANLRLELQRRGLLEPGPADVAALHVALLRFLGDSDAALLLVALEDLWGETEPQNVPGTPVDRPNWVQRFPMDLDQLVTDRGVANVLEAVQQARLGSHFRARHHLEEIS